MTRDEVVEYIQQVRFGYLATVGEDGQPRVRPVAITTIYGDALYFFTYCTTRKVAEMAHNPAVEVVWCKLEEQSQVRIRGKVTVVEDEAVKERFKADNPIVNKMLPPQAQHLFQLYSLTPSSVHAAAGLVPYTEVAW